VRQEDFETYRAGRAKMAIGNITVTSLITRETSRFEFTVIHLGETELTGGVRPASDAARYEAMKRDLSEDIRVNGIASVIRVLDEYFEEPLLSIRSLFRDEQRRILDRVTPLEQTLDAMSRAAEAGKIDRFGISNASLADAQMVRSLVGETLAARFEYVENEYNLLATADTEALIPYCVGHGLRYTAFSPLAGGFLTGKYRFGEPAPPNSRLAHAPEVCAGYSNEQSFAAIDRLRRAAEARRQPMAEAALRFVLDTPGVDGLIIAPRRVEHFAGLGLQTD